MALMRDPTEVDPEVITEQDTVVALEKMVMWRKRTQNTPQWPILWNPSSKRQKTVAEVMKIAG